MEQLCYAIHVHKDTYLQVIIKAVCPNVSQITVVSVIRVLTITVNNVLMDFIQMKLGDVWPVLLKIVKPVPNLFALIVLMVID
jgi:hypothetical protein